jgi:lysylphosphatidylglycerol synthetase-like protein (DUF2156 family)
MKRSRLFFNIALGFILLEALVWAVFGLIIALDLHPALPASPSLRTAMVVISWILAIALVVLFFLLRRRTRGVYVVTLLLVELIALVTILDDLAWVDAAVLLVAAIAFAALMAGGKWYSAKNREEDNAVSG